MTAPCFSKILFRKKENRSATIPKPMNIRILNVMIISKCHAAATPAVTTAKRIVVGRFVIARSSEFLIVCLTVSSNQAIRGKA